MWLRNRKLGIPPTEDGLFGNLLIFEYFWGTLPPLPPPPSSTLTFFCPTPLLYPLLSPFALSPLPSSPPPALSPVPSAPRSSSRPLPSSLPRLLSSTLPPSTRSLCPINNRPIRKVEFWRRESIRGALPPDTTNILGRRCLLDPPLNGVTALQTSLHLGAEAPSLLCVLCVFVFWGEVVSFCFV